MKGYSFFPCGEIWCLEYAYQISGQSFFQTAIAKHIFLPRVT